MAPALSRACFEPPAATTVPCGWRTCGMGRAAGPATRPRRSSVRLHIKCLGCRACSPGQAGSSEASYDSLPPHRCWSKEHALCGPSLRSWVPVGLGFPTYWKPSAGLRRGAGREMVPFGHRGKNGTICGLRLLTERAWRSKSEPHPALAPITGPSSRVLCVLGRAIRPGHPECYTVVLNDEQRVLNSTGKPSAKYEAMREKAGSAAGSTE